MREHSTRRPSGAESRAKESYTTFFDLPFTLDVYKIVPRYPHSPRDTKCEHIYAREFTRSRKGERRKKSIQYRSRFLVYRYRIFTSRKLHPLCKIGPRDPFHSATRVSSTRALECATTLARKTEAAFPRVQMTTMPANWGSLTRQPNSGPVSVVLTSRFWTLIGARAARNFGRTVRRSYCFHTALISWGAATDSTPSPRIV